MTHKAMLEELFRAGYITPNAYHRGLRMIKESEKILKKYKESDQSSKEESEE